MSEKKTPHETVYHPDAAETMEERLLQGLKGFAEKYSWHILIIFVAVVVAIMAAKGYHNRKQADAIDSWAQLSTLPPVSPWMPEKEAKRLRQETITRCNEILQNHWRTSATPWVLLRLATTELDAGQPAEAARHFKTLIDSYGSETPGRLALRLYGCALEEEKKYAEAGAWFQSIENRVPEGLKAQVLWDAGRNFDLADQKGPAERAYRRAIELEPEGPLASLSRYRLDAMARGEQIGGVPESVESPEPVEEPKAPETAPAGEKTEPAPKAPSETPAKSAGAKSEPDTAK